MKKICIIVDHPERDLQGLIYLASKLKKKNYTFFLVPFYNFREIYLIKPNIVFLNHSRWTYYNFIKILSYLKIDTYVLDTEGGMITGELIEEYILYSNIKNNINYIKGYCIWSEEIKKNLLNHTKNLKKSKLLVTGNPRFNFIKRNKKKVGESILVNLNFATINPKFQNYEEEKKILLKQGKSIDWIKLYSKDQSKMRKYFILLIKKLSTKFFYKSIIVRPHPYENHVFYEKKFKELKNVIISRNESIYEAINKSFVVIQNNCGTTIDATLLGRPIIFYQPFKSKILDQELILNLSYLCNTENKVCKKINFFYRNKNLKKTFFLKLINKKFVSLKDNTKIFDKLIKKSINMKISNINLLILLLKNEEFFHISKMFIKIFLGKKIFNLFNSKFHLKIFNKQDVKSTIDKICSLDNKNKKKLIAQNIKKFFFNLFSIKLN